MEQLRLCETELTSQARKKVEKLLRSYRNMDAIIESMEKDTPETKMTVNYEASESQRSNQFSSQVENVVMMRDKLHQKKITKAKLDILYKSVREVQQKIWVYAYIDGTYDDLAIQEIKVSRNRYYREKSSLIKVVAEAFYLI